MASIVSSPLSPNDRILADHLNRLWRDLHQNHIHDAENQVDHADLIETGPMSGVTYDHGDIDDHIDAVYGIHGLNASAYPIGYLGAGRYILAGITTLSNSAVIWTTENYRYVDISFSPYTFGSTPAINVTIVLDHTTLPYDITATVGENIQILWIENLSTSGFRACFAHGSWVGAAGLHWSAIGSL